MSGIEEGDHVVFTNPLGQDADDYEEALVGCEGVVMRVTGYGDGPDYQPILVRFRGYDGAVFGDIPDSDERGPYLEWWCNWRAIQRVVT